MTILFQMASRMTCSFIAMITFTILLAIYVGSDNTSFIVLLLFGFYFAWKGIVILPIVSLFIDKFIFNALLKGMKLIFSFIFWILIYGFVGMIIGRIVYGKDMFFIESGVITSVIYVIYLQVWRRFYDYQRKKIDEIGLDQQ